MSKISVIVPVYNSEAYLPECIESILSQTFSDIDIVLVNDGSTDNSGSICDKYACKDSRITVHHKENGGVTSARKSGVDLCKTDEFICFVDSDDTLPQSALEDLYSSVSEQYDIIVGSYDRNPNVYNDSEMPIEQYRSFLVSSTYIHTGPVAKLFRKELFNDLTFAIPREIRKGEDSLMNIRLAFSTIKSVKIIPKVVYNYRINTASVMSTFNSTPEYEELFYKHLTASIPENEKNNYLKAIITSQLYTLPMLASSYYKNNKWGEYGIHKQLLKDIESTNYKLSFLQRVALLVSNPITSYIFGLIYKLKNKA